MKKIILASTIALAACLGGDHANAKENWFSVWNKSLAASAAQNGGNPEIIDDSRTNGKVVVFFKNKGVDYMVTNDTSGNGLAHVICSSVGNSPLTCIDYDTGRIF